MKSVPLDEMPQRVQEYLAQRDASDQPTFVLGECDEGYRWICEKKLGDWTGKRVGKLDEVEEPEVRILDLDKILEKANISEPDFAPATPITESKGTGTRRPITVYDDYDVLLAQGYLDEHGNADLEVIQAGPAHHAHVEDEHIHHYIPLQHIGYPPMAIGHRLHLKIVELF